MRRTCWCVAPRDGPRGSNEGTVCPPAARCSAPTGWMPNRFLPPIAPARGPAWAEGALLGGLGGSLNRYADLQTVIRGVRLARQRQPRVQAYLVGEGVLRNSTQALAHELGAESYVRFIDSVPYEKVPLHMA